MADPERRRRFEALLREHHPAVRAYARRRVPSEVVDDVVSETFLVVWRRLDAVPEPALPWVLAVARNVVGTEWRGSARRERLWLKAQGMHLEGSRRRPIFPLWDTNIATGYSVRLGRKGTNHNRYWRFMLDIRGDCVDLGGEAKWGEGLVKRIDEFNYCRYSKNPPLI
jgi:hypothetical protein